MWRKIRDINIFKSKRNYLTIPAIPSSVWTNPLHFIAFGFGSGTIPFAPGTFGTLIAIPFYLMLSNVSAYVYLSILIFIVFASVLICEKTSRDIKVDDHQGMNLDEIVGFLVTMFLAPLGWKWIGLGFVLFRLFDILKPWPIRWLDEKIHGGLGAILDDIVAGVFAFFVIQIVAKFF